MTEHDDKWLDELISNTINTGKPEFDAEKWKKEYRHEFGILTSRSQVTTDHGVWLHGSRGLFVKLAVAAAIVIAAALLLSRSATDEQLPQEPGRIDVVKDLPEQMLTFGSLRSAYAHGGVDAVEMQFDLACRELNVRPIALSVGQLLVSSNGS